MQIFKFAFFVPDKYFPMITFYFFLVLIHKAVSRRISVKKLDW